MLLLLSYGFLVEWERCDNIENMIYANNETINSNTKLFQSEITALQKRKNITLQQKFIILGLPSDDQPAQPHQAPNSFDESRNNSSQ